MSHHSHHTTGASGGSDHPKAKKGLHRDWRFIAAVVLMLIAMCIYVMTLDGSVVPEIVPAGDASAESSVPAAP